MLTRAIDKNYFEKSDGDIRALIVNIEARELLRILIDNEELRDNPNSDYDLLKGYNILEDAFEDNIRVYLRQRSKINRNIKKTALTQNDHHRFFYFNNGITITCDYFSYLKSTRSPMIELQNLQVVNGSQTIHALHDAFKENSDLFDNIDILVRIYETHNADLSTRIAEYTNSQNPVNSRDIRSIDYAQQTLEAEFAAQGLFYERKKNQYSGQPKAKRLDAEKAGQVLFALYNNMPLEAKNDKRLIFGDRYEEIFNDSINADKVLLAYRLFDKIEKAKDKKREAWSLGNLADFDEESYILVASYHILYVMGQLAEKKSIQLVYKNLDQIWSLYSDTLKILREIVNTERTTDEKYSHINFFKSIKPKKIFDEQIAPKL